MNRDVVNRYVVNPIMVSAVQFNGANVEIIREFVGIKLSAFHRKNNQLHVVTPVGLMLVNVGDFVVSGFRNDYWVCDEENFNLNHEVCVDGNAEDSKATS